MKPEQYETVRSSRGLPNLVFGIVWMEVTITVHKNLLYCFIFSVLSARFIKKGENIPSLCKKTLKQNKKLKNKNL